MNIKKVISAILCAGMLMSVTSAYAQEYVYTSSGIKRPFYGDNDSYDGLTALSLPGATVECKDMAFSKRIKLYDAPFNSYSIFGNSDNADTLTLGIIEVTNLEWTNRKKIQDCVYKQINYIKSVGGIMTGYSIIDLGWDNYALNISWDANNAHHFARFELGMGRDVVGYYDYMFMESNNISDSRINYMNNTFRVVYEFQHDYWEPHTIYGE